MKRLTWQDVIKVRQTVLYGLYQLCNLPNVVKTVIYQMLFLVILNASIFDKYS